MNGLLYPQPEGVLMDPRQAMIMQTGLGLMGASGPSLTPVNLGQAIGKAGMQGMEAYTKTAQANQQSKLFQIKLAEFQREAAERNKKEQAMAALRADPRFANLGPLLDVAPNLAVERAIPKPKETPNPFTRLDPKDYTSDSLVKFQQSGNVADLVAAPKSETQRESPLAALLRERNALPPNDPRIPAYEDAIKRATTSQPLVNVDTRGENKFSERVGTEMGEQYAGLLRADMNAPATIGKYQRLGNLLSQVGTGKFTGTTVDLKAAAKALGVDLTAMGVADNVAPAQAARALSNQLALELRNPAGGAGMPGAMSDQDREFLKQMIPSLENDPAAWPKMIDYRVKLAEREQQVAKMARAYRKKNGKFDEDFYDELQEWSNKNPLFKDEAPKPAPAGLSPAEQQELDALRKRFKK